LYAASGCLDGIRGDHVLLAPPYNVSTVEIDIIVETAGKVIEEVFANISRG
jgi:adenosylmethionine-8-amino-7-oxononanoate aminotransferase